MWLQLFIIGCIVTLMEVESHASTEIEQVEAKVQKCMCANYQCGCCNHIEIDFAKINGTLCSNMSYLPNDIGIALTVTYNKLTIYNETLSVRNPPRICPILVEDLHIEACIRFYNIDFDRHHLDGCVEAEISAFRAIPLVKKDLGCFHMGHRNSSNNFVPYSVVILK